MTIFPNCLLLLTAISLPGVPPTGKYLRIPFTAIVNIRGDRLYHEHIAWEQATVLRQLEILPDHLSYRSSAASQIPGEQVEKQLRLPVAGVDCAVKMADKNSIPSNGMIGWE